MILYPHAKINIGLSVIERRSDGYHNIETFFYPVPLCDILTVEPAKVGKLTFSCHGIPLSECEPLNNLCCRAYNILDADFCLPPTNIRLQKIIPAGAGLGGGSSDAAFTLMALNDLYKLQISNEKMNEYADRLGSDCPFFLQKRPAFASGKGELLTPVRLSLDDYYIMIVKPPASVNTTEAYSWIKPKTRKNQLFELLNEPVYKWRHNVFNDFEEAVFEKFPQIAEAKEMLYLCGAIYASMSGSGACVFGIFSENPENMSSQLPDSFFVKIISNHHII